MRFEAPQSVDAAVALLAGARGVAKILAGGSDILIQMRGGRVEPELLVDVKGISEMRSISNDNGVWRIGAATPCMEIVEHAGFSKAWPGVTEAIALIGSIQIKGRATVGGNLCNASPAADSIPALIAAAAMVTIVGPKGKREAKVEELCTGQGRDRDVDFVSQAPRAFERCLSALHATHRDGYRGGWRGREPHTGRQGGMYRRTRGAGCGECHADTGTRSCCGVDR
jgi:CO/xanthine dehydrogenase FAD-binding subunit